MIEYTEEVAGILAVQLYDAPACRAIVEQANNVDAWMEAKVSEHGQDGDFNSASRPEARLARVLSPAEHSAVRLDFDEKM
jgi:hypothetical protein